MWGTLVKSRFSKAAYKSKQASADVPDRTSFIPTCIAKTSNCSNSGSCRMSDIFPPLMNLTELDHWCSNFTRFSSKYLNIESPTKRMCWEEMLSEKERSVTLLLLLSQREDWSVTIEAAAGEGSSQAASDMSEAATLEETCALVSINVSLVVRGTSLVKRGLCGIRLVVESLESPAANLGEEDALLAAAIEPDLTLSRLIPRAGHSSSSMTPWLLHRENTLTADRLVLGYTLPRSPGNRVTEKSMGLTSPTLPDDIRLHISVFVCRSDLCPRPRLRPPSRLPTATPSERNLMNNHPTSIATSMIR